MLCFEDVYLCIRSHLPSMFQIAAAKISDFPSVARPLPDKMSASHLITEGSGPFLSRRLLEGPGDLIELAIDAARQGRHAGDNGDSDKRREQAIFDRSGAGFVGEELLDGHHGDALLGFKSWAPEYFRRPGPAFQRRAPPRKAARGMCIQLYILQKKSVI